MRILHLFNWQLSDIVPKLSKIKEQGFDAIQINPIQPLKEEGFENWWLSYQPCGFTIGNQYGSRDDLIKLCYFAHVEGLQVFPDVILTHVADDCNAPLTPNEKVDKELIYNNKIWRPKKNISNWDSRYEVTHYCAGLPTFDHYSKDLPVIVADFLNELIDCGADGFRIDSAKSIPTPSDDCNFLPQVLSRLKKDVYCYGEVIFASEDLINQYKDYINVLTNMWSVSRDDTVAFVESHDSFFEFKYTCNYSDSEITDRYRRLAALYPNTLYYARSFSNEWESTNVRLSNLQYVPNNCLQRQLIKNQKKWNFM